MSLPSVVPTTAAFCGQFAARPTVERMQSLLKTISDALERCEAGGITRKNCPASVREWITRERRRR